MKLDYIETDDIMVSREVYKEKFLCNLKECKGACCTLHSDAGAPVTEEEIEIIKKHLPVIMEYLPEEHRREIEEKGYAEEKYDQLLLRSLNDRACVFVIWDGDIAKCGIEKAYRDGKIDFIKPVSCHLYPIRISYFGGPVLKYERIAECEPAIRENGIEKPVILDFCKEAIERAFGKDFYMNLKKSERSVK